MTELIKKGQTRTFLIAMSIILVSLHTIYFYHSVRPELESKKLLQQGIRFLLTVAFLVAAYKGKLWAKQILLVLFSIANIGAILSVLSIETAPVAKIPLLVMILVYSIALYHFGFSKSYKAFYEYQNEGKSDL